MLTLKKVKRKTKEILENNQVIYIHLAIYELCTLRAEALRSSLTGPLLAGCYFYVLKAQNTGE